MSVSISMEHLVKRYGNNTIISDLSLEIRNGEFFTLLGPSGCGKTTLLRMIAGFNSVEGGRLCFDGQDITSLPAWKRNIGMVFQNYAIFPNMSVRKNVEYGFRERKVPRSEVKSRVDEILRIVRITELADRMPDQLSGGQLQRVALARAIVIHPNVLLMDEPLSNLDAKLRVELRDAIREVQQQIGITTVYVTHDQEEALAVSDRIAVMNKGDLQQVGVPVEVYSRPKNGFVATFIGRSGMLKCTVRGGKMVFPDGSALPLPPDAAAREGQSCVLAVRPEEFIPAEEGIPASVRSSTFLGRSVHTLVDFASGVALEGYPPVELEQAFSGSAGFAKGEKIHLRVNEKRVNLFTEDLSTSLMKGAGRHA